MAESNMTAHRIRLRGPWQVESIAPSGKPARTVHLPVGWDDLAADGAHRVRLSRRFHRPTNLGSDDQVLLVVNSLPEGAEVALNGVKLERQIGTAGQPAVFPARQLEPTNVVTLEFDVDALPNGDGLWGDVALLISSP